jgi:hypothetical protein
VTLSDTLTPLRDYLAHDSWRCDGRNRDRFPASEWVELGGCHCGLVAALETAGCGRQEALHIAETITQVGA